MAGPYPAKKLTGRTYRISEGKCVEVRIPYQVVTPRLTAAPGIGDLTGFPGNGAELTAADATGLDVVEGLVMREVDVSEDASGIKWIFTATYNAPSNASGEGDVTVWGQIETARSWGSQDISIDISHDAATGEAILNAVGDPFQSVPQVPRACPVFNVTRKTTMLMSSALEHSGTINANSVTIDGVTIPPHCGRLIVSTRKLYNDPQGFGWEITYTVAVMSRKVGDKEVGWDIALVENGFYHFDSEGKRVQAVDWDEETKKSYVRSTPVLLTTDGKRNDTKTSVDKIVRGIPAVAWGIAF